MCSNPTKCRKGDRQREALKEVHFAPPADAVGCAGFSLMSGTAGSVHGSFVKIHSVEMKVRLLFEIISKMENFLLILIVCSSIAGMYCFYLICRLTY